MLEFLDTGDFWAARGSGYRLPYFVPQASTAVICPRRRRDIGQQNTVAFMQRVELHVNNGEEDDSSSRVAPFTLLAWQGQCDYHCSSVLQSVAQTLQSLLTSPYLRNLTRYGSLVLPASQYDCYQPAPITLL